MSRSKKNKHNKQAEIHNQQVKAQSAVTNAALPAKTAESSATVPLKTWPKIPDVTKLSLRFSQLCWMKLTHLRDKTQNEIGFFGITDKDDLLLVKDVVVVKQEVSQASANFDDNGVADYFDDCVDKGLKPEQFGRIWIHTHPTFGPSPSSIDEDTFARVFGKCHWSVMCIVAGDGTSYARLQYNIGPKSKTIISVKVLTEMHIPDEYRKLWGAEYDEKVTMTNWGFPIASAGYGEVKDIVSAVDGSIRIVRETEVGKLALTEDDWENLMLMDNKEYYMELEKLAENVDNLHIDGYNYADSRVDETIDDEWDEKFGFADDDDDPCG
ncbi:hypothetical protein LCGC14_0475840 [marine sediment metagenome]|uniref:JAB domain-containing protein n=1 Tax=marine sediment metagenome TaxID=412755 RepID=A0A0F9STL8_9ZZZZ